MSRPPLPLPPEDRLPPSGNRADELEDAIWQILDLASGWTTRKLTEAQRLEFIAKYGNAVLEDHLKRYPRARA